jgi:hypothetical protein
MILRNINMMYFVFETNLPEEAKTGLGWDEVEAQFDDIIMLSQEGDDVYLNIDFNSEGGDVHLMFMMLNRFKQLNQLGVKVNINICGPIISAGAFLLLILLDRNLCTFSYDELSENYMLFHEVYSLLDSNKIKDEKESFYVTKEHLEKMNLKLCDIIHKYIPLTKEQNSDFKKGRDIIIDTKIFIEKTKELKRFQNDLPEDVL